MSIFATENSNDYSMRYLYATLVVAMIILSNIRMEAQSMSDVLLDVPMSIMPTINTNARLDMIDLYQAGMQAKSPTLLGDTASIVTMGDTFIEVRTSKLSTIQIKKLGKPRKPLYAVITTVATPALHSRVELYNEKWEQLPIAKRMPSITVDDFINDTIQDHKRQELLEQVYVRTIQYTMQEENSTLVAIPTFLQIFDVDRRKELQPYFIDTLALTWKGKKWIMR